MPIPLSNAAQARASESNLLQFELSELVPLFALDQLPCQQGQLFTVLLFHPKPPLVFELRVAFQVVKANEQRTNALLYFLAFGQESFIRHAAGKRGW